MIRLRAGVIAVIVVAALAPAPQVLAATLEVTTTEDETLVNETCSLREAVIAANTDSPVDACPAGSGSDTITLAAGTYVLDEDGPLEDSSATGDLDISSDLQIVGAGVEATIIDGSAFPQPDRIIQILDPGPGLQLAVTMNNLTVRNGNAPDNRNGGGIKADGKTVLDLNNVAVRNNTATCDACPGTVDGNGGAIYFGFDADESTLSIANSTIDNNEADCNGGGISFEGDSSGLTIGSSQITNNRGSCEGGGMDVDNVNGSISIQGGSLSSNSITCVICDGDDLALGKGGGINVTNATLSIVGTTVANNSVTVTAMCGICTPFASARGGGIHYGVDGGQTNLTSVTFSQNAVSATANTTGGSSPESDASGGGFHDDLGTPTITSSSFIGNSATADATAACSGCGQAKARGGAFFHYDRPASIVGSSFGTNLAQVSCSTCSDPSRSALGGAIYNDSDPLSIGTTGLRDNSVICTACGQEAQLHGGAIYINAGPTEMRESALVRSAATLGGGLFQLAGSLALTNSTISTNRVGCSACGPGSSPVTGAGGGLYLLGELVSATVVNTTIADNTSTGTGAGIEVEGTARATLASTLFANNQAAGGTRQSCSTGSPVAPGAITSSGYNLDDDSTCQLIQPGDKSGITDAGIEVLALNAPGSTETHALEPLSPAIDAGSPSCPPPANDQRGMQRPLDGPDSGSTATCDIGAYELKALPSLTLEPANSNGEIGLSHSVTATLRDSDNNPIPQVTVRFTVGGANQANAAITTDSAGRAVFTYTATNTGTDNISATGDLNGNGTRDGDEPIGNATRVWVPRLARTIDCAPPAASAKSGTQHTVTCTVTSTGDQAVPNESVTFSFSGVGELSSPTVVTTNQLGQASVTTSSDTRGDQAITAVLTSDLTGPEPEDVDECDRAANDPSGSVAGRCSDDATVTWNDEASLVALEPSEATTDRGGTRTVTVEITGSDGSPMEGATVTWSTSGVGSIVSADETTDAEGHASAIVTSAAFGNQNVTATTPTCAPDGICSDAALLHWGPERCDIFGTVGPDILSGTPGNDVICGFGGDDVLRGKGGNDILLGSVGKDLLIGGPGVDELQGGPSDDRLFGHQGADSLNGGPGRDHCRGGGGSDEISGCET